MQAREPLNLYSAEVKILEQEQSYDDCVRNMTEKELFCKFII